MRVCVVGLGKLGAPLAAVWASAGHEIVGVDVLEDNVAAINERRSPVPEPLVESLLQDRSARIRATLSLQDGVNSSEVTFLVLPTPSMLNGEFNVSYIQKAIQDVGQALKNNPNYHLVVITSTVMPGDTALMEAILAANSGRHIFTEVGLCYNPEFIALGDVVNGVRSPDLILVGESDPRAGDKLFQLYDTINRIAPRRRMNYVNAELTKLALNSYVTTKISFANLVGRLAERTLDADAHTILEAMAVDRRISPHTFKAGLGFGGPCFPRDNQAFAHVFTKAGVSNDISRATVSHNREQPTFVADAIGCLGDFTTYTVLGLTYRPNTPILDESQAVDVARLLARRKNVRAYDPYVKRDGLDHMNRDRLFGVQVCDDLKSALKHSDCVIIATAHDEFEHIYVDPRFPPQLLIDCWGRYPNSVRTTPKVKCVRLGRWCRDA